MNAPQVTEYQDYAEFLAAVTARGQSFETGWSNYPGDEGDLHAVVVDHMGEAVGHWGPVSEDAQGWVFAGVLAPTGDGYHAWIGAEVVDDDHSGHMGG